MAGSIPLSMTQQMDQYGDPLSGGKLYGFVAGTVSTPQNFFQDLALTLPWPNPITLDASGRVPQLMIADGLIKIRLTDSAGVVQLSADNCQVIGASSGGGGGGAIDATTIAQTGDIKKRYGLGSHTGWVRCNGNSIGSSVSGATERANADAQALFQYLWGIDANLAVSGGRGGTSLADWNANKQIALPDGRGTSFVGMDDMGATSAGRLTATYFGTAATVLGARGGSESNTLAASQIPAHSHPNTLSDPGHVHPFNFNVAVISPGGSWGAAPPAIQTTISSTASSGINGTGITITNANNTAGGGAHNNVPPSMVITFYIKL